MGVSLNNGTPQTPQNDHFYYENPWLLGKPTIWGNIHMNYGAYDVPLFFVALHTNTFEMIT